MSIFEIDRKYTKEQVAAMRPDLFNRLSKDYSLQPGALGTNPRIRAASTILFDEGACFGWYLNAAAAE